MPSTPTTNSTPVSSTAASTPSTQPASTVSKTKTRPSKKATAKPDAGEGTLVDKTVQKTVRKPSTKTTAKKPVSAFETPAEADWHKMISETAYYRAESRGFHPGYEHEDWAWAEEEVRKKLARE